MAPAVTATSRDSREAPAPGAHRAARHAIRARLAGIPWPGRQEVGIGLRVLAPVLFLAVVAAVLLQTVPDEIDEPLVPDTLGWQPLPVMLPSVVDASGIRLARVRLIHSEPERLLAFPEVKLLFATHGARLRLQGGRLTLDGTSCAYEIRRGTVLGDNEYLAFSRGAACYGVHLPPGGVFTLEVRFRGADRIDAWTYVPPENWREGPFLELPDASHLGGGRPPVMRGRLVRIGTGDGLKRIALLNYLWQISAAPTWIWIALAAATALMIVGTLTYPWGPVTRVSPALRWRTGIVAACLAGSLGLTYAVVVPPFHAPDEPDHLLSYARASGEPRLAAEAAMLARLGHFERIKFHSDERFRPADMGAPLPTAWGSHVFTEDVEGRSPTTASFWKVISPMLRESPVPRVILGIRLANVVVFAVAMGLAGLLAGALSTGPYRQAAVVPFLLVPTLPFFAMHLSELGILVSCYVLLSVCLTLLLHDGPASHLVGLPLGIACALAFAGGRSGLPLFPVVACALAGRILLSTRGAAVARRLWAPVTFWGTFALGSATFYLVTTETARIQLQAIAQTYAIGWLAVALTVLEHPVGWIFAILLLCALVEMGFLLLRQRVRLAWPNRILSGVGVAGAVVLLVQFVTSLFVAYPTLGVIEARVRPGAWEYAREVFGVMGTSFRFGRPDHLLVESFWSGFGWVDALPPTVVPAALTVASGLALVVLLVHLSRAGDGRRLVVVGVIGAGLAASLAVYAVASLAIIRNLYGRYLVGWYLIALGVAWSAAVLLPPLSRGRVPRTVWLIGACGVVQAYCLTVVLRRYF